MRESVAIVASNLGSLLTVYALLMATPVAVAVGFGEWFAVPPVLAAVGVTGATGRLLDRVSDPGESRAVHGIVTAAIGWFLAGVYGALPILFVAWTVAVDPEWLATPDLTATVATFLSPANALFEGMSGVTGTGLTMTRTEDHLPHAVQWWRSLMQWVGGIGVVVLAAAVMLTSESDALQSLYEEKAAVQSIRPDTRETIEALWWIFCLLTFVATVAFWLAGMPPWHALNHAMTGVSTGGFVVVDDGIAAYDSPLLEAAVVPFMLLGAVSFAVHHYLLQGEVELLWRDAQTRWLLGLAAAGAAVVAAVLTLVDPPVSAVRYAVFQYVSALTCTGFQTDTALGARWPAAGLVVVASTMVVGGAAGSTAGGIKLVRTISLARGTLHAVTDYFREEEDWELAVAEEEADATAGHSASEFEQAAAIGVLWICLLVATTIVSLRWLPAGPGGASTAEVLFEVASAQGNVGLSTGITGPTMPTPVKAAFLASMWIGRLEIVPVIVTLRAIIKGFE